MSQGLKLGSTLRNGAYRIEKVLGQGSFGITYLATKKITTQGNLGTMEVEAQFAIKEFFMSEINSRKSDGSSVDGSSGNVFSNYRNKFKKEAESLSRLSHPNIVKVIDVFDENNTTYYVMEFLRGTNLDDKIKQCGCLAEGEAISIVQEVGGALDYLHSQKMLHLDIKPKNIMCKSDGKNCLIDFGLSKQFAEDGEPESSTNIGLGTPGYAPIEQASYKQDGTFPATLDVYALGATMFKMLTGKRPPEATSLLNEGFPKEDIERIGVSRNVADALEKAMAPIKRKRYQTIAEFLNALGSYDVEEVTVIEKPEIKPQSESEKPIILIEPEKPITSPESESVEQSKPPKHKSKWFLLIIFIVIIIIIVISISVGQCQGSGNGSDSDSVMIPPTPQEEACVYVNDMEWDSPLGKAIYTGDVVDSIPNGNGIAKIIEGEFAGCVYDGEFSFGTMSGQTTYTLKNGDIFLGTFANNQYEKGRYTFKSDGDYFEGNFKDGKISEGVWYDKNGKKL